MGKNHHVSGLAPRAWDEASTYMKKIAKLEQKMDDEHEEWMDDAMLLERLSSGIAEIGGAMEPEVYYSLFG